MTSKGSSSKVVRGCASWAPPRSTVVDVVDVVDGVPDLRVSPEVFDEIAELLAAAVCADLRAFPDRMDVTPPGSNHGRRAEGPAA
jgi:hypothetical protein